MDANWLETAGQLALPTYATIVGTLIVGCVWRISRPSTPVESIDRRQLSGAMPPGELGLSRRNGNWSWWVAEYLGNTGGDDVGLVDRRGPNFDLRSLLNRLRHELERRAIAHEVGEPFLEELRAAVRSERRLLESPDGVDETVRRFLVARRWELAERLNALLDDPPAEMVDGLKSTPFTEDPEGTMQFDAE